MTEELQDELYILETEPAKAISALVFVLALAPFKILLSRRAILVISLFAEPVTAKHKDMKRERQKSENLLNKMLPKIIATSLREGKETAKTFSEVTMSFIKIVGFQTLTQVSKKNGAWFFKSDWSNGFYLHNVW